MAYCEFILKVVEFIVAIDIDEDGECPITFADYCYINYWRIP